MSNVARGDAFQLLTKRVLETRLGTPLRAEVAISIGSPPHPHRFDLVSYDGVVVVECKAFTWTGTGNIPSAKLTTLREAVFYMTWLPEESKKILAMACSNHPKRNESLGEYFVRLNAHLLGDVIVCEIDDEGRIIVLHGDLG